MSVNTLAKSENFSEIYSQCDLRFAPAKITSLESKRSIFAEFSIEKSHESLNHASFCLRHSSDFLTYLSQYSSYYETGNGKLFLFTSSSCLLKKIIWHVKNQFSSPLSIIYKYATNFGKGVFIIVFWCVLKLIGLLITNMATGFC